MTRRLATLLNALVLIGLLAWGGLIVVSAGATVRRWVRQRAALQSA